MYITGNTQNVCCCKWLNFNKSTSEGCCLEIYSYTLLSHLFHFTAAWTSDLLLTKRIHKTLPDKHNFNHTDTPRARPKAVTGIELTTPGSAQWTWQERRHAFFLSATGVPAQFHNYAYNNNDSTNFCRCCCFGMKRIIVVRDTQK